MNTMELRDHSQPCKHPSARTSPGAFVLRGVWQCDVPDCPGGKKITLISVGAWRSDQGDRRKWDTHYVIRKEE